MLLSTLLRNSFQFRMDDAEVKDYFAAKNIKAELKTYEAQNRTIFFASTGPDTSQMIVFIHGTPGAWTNFINFLGTDTLLNRYRLVAVERPGFGNSDFGYPEPSLEKQALLIQQVLKMNKSSRRPIVIGHSIGGPDRSKNDDDVP